MNKPQAPNKRALRSSWTRVSRKIKRLAETDDRPYELGQLLTKVHRAKLFANARDVDGAPTFRGFADFVTRDVGISRATAYAMMDVALHFSREKVERFGVTKLAEVLKVPEAKRATVLKLMAQGASVRQVKAVVAKVGPVRRDTGRKKMPLAPTPRKKALEQVTTILSVERQGIGLHLRIISPEGATYEIDLP